MRLFRNESGFALPLALLVMVTTSAILVTAITTTSSTGRTANLGKTARQRPGAGRGRARQRGLDPGQAGPEHEHPGAVPEHRGDRDSRYTMENGTAKLWGVYNTTTNVWTLYAKGSLPNPTGGAPITKTLSRTAQVLGIAAGATVPEWSRFLYDDASTCFTIDTVTIPGAVASRGPMCLKNGGNVAVNSTGAATTVGVGTNPHRRGAGRRERLAHRADASPTSAGRMQPRRSWPRRTPAGRPTPSQRNTQSGNLDTTGFFVGANIPTTAIIHGITVEIVRRADNTLRRRRGRAPAQGRCRRR